MRHRFELFVGGLIILLLGSVAEVFVPAAYLLSEAGELVYALTITMVWVSVLPTIQGIWWKLKRTTLVALYLVFVIFTIFYAGGVIPAVEITECVAGISLAAITMMAVKYSLGKEWLAWETTDLGDYIVDGLNTFLNKIPGRVVMAIVSLLSCAMLLAASWELLTATNTELFLEVPPNESSLRSEHFIFAVILEVLSLIPGFFIGTALLAEEKH